VGVPDIDLSKLVMCEEKIGKMQVACRAVLFGLRALRYLRNTSVMNGVPDSLRRSPLPMA
jgi:hypothetical protein